MTSVTSPPTGTEKKPWPALWALVVGFFMILVDSTIVSVATPTIAEKLNADINSVIWVTSAYLLAYAVPLLITGRLGDRFGPKVLYQVGLVVFTLASLWCGFAGSIEMLIVARVVQGLGAAMMTPQTMSVITRIFPPQNRGAAMGLWGAVAGVASLVGPIVGGLLVDGFGWEWIFFVNVPVGVVAFVLAQRFVPSFERHGHRFDYLGIVLSAVGLFLLVFGIQEGETYDWGVITGPISVWSLIITGIVVLVAFVVWQGVQKGEPLLPLGLFKDRNFTLANVAITAVGVAISSFALPIMLWAQDVLRFSPTQAALLLVPQAVISAGLAPLVGKNSTSGTRAGSRRSASPASPAVCSGSARCSGRVPTGAGRSCRVRCSVSRTPACGGRCRSLPRATCRRSSRVPARASTTPPGRSVPCSVPPASPP